MTTLEQDRVLSLIKRIRTAHEQLDFTIKESNDPTLLILSLQVQHAIDEADSQARRFITRAPRGH